MCVTSGRAWCGWIQTFMSCGISSNLPNRSNRQQPSIGLLVDALRRAQLCDPLLAVGRSDPDTGNADRFLGRAQKPRGRPVLWDRRPQGLQQIALRNSFIEMELHQALHNQFLLQFLCGPTSLPCIAIFPIVLASKLISSCHRDKLKRRFSSDLRTGDWREHIQRRV